VRWLKMKRINGTKTLMLMSGASLRLKTRKGIITILDLPTTREVKVDKEVA